MPKTNVKEKQFVFVGGMPRAGSTLLQAILDQNPQNHAWITSGLIEVMLGVRNSWDKYIEHQAAEEAVSTHKKKAVLQAIMGAYYAEIEAPYIFDKSRGWLAHIELLEWVLGRKVKILVPVRDLREILASFELLWRNTAKESQMMQEQSEYLNMQTVAGRCAMWMQPNQPVGLAYNRIHDVIRRGYRERLHFVRYEDLCNNPDSTMNGIYQFLEMPHFTHDFENIIKHYKEDDRVHGLLDLHSIKPKIKRTIMKADGVLGGDVAKKYAGQYPWDLQ